MRAERRVGAERRWVARPVVARLVRVAILVVPAGSGATTGIVLERVLAPRTAPVAAIVAALVGSAAVAMSVECVARRFLPLAALLKLSLAFPDRVPSRFRIARQAGNARVLRERIDRARASGVDDDPSRAAVEILTLVAALSAHDRKTRGHSERVRAFTDLLAEEIDDADIDRDRLRWAALLHDIGKLEVPASTLNKPGKPDAAEWEQLKRHPLQGQRIVGGLLPWLGTWGAVIAEHHERFDGAGYPGGIGGDAIHVGARIVAVADSFEVMTAARSYKRPMTPSAARRELAACAGKQFDPMVVRALFSVSLGRLWWMVGPAAWIAQVPFMLGIGRAGTEAVGAVRTASDVAVRTVSALLAVALSAAAGTARAPTTPASSTRAGVAAPSVSLDAIAPGSIAPGSSTIASGRGHRPASRSTGGSTNGASGGGGSVRSPEPSDPAPVPSPTTGGLVGTATGALSDVSNTVSDTTAAATNTVGGTVDQTSGTVSQTATGVSKDASSAVQSVSDAAGRLLGS